MRCAKPEAASIFFTRIFVRAGARIQSYHEYTDAPPSSDQVKTGSSVHGMLVPGIVATTGALTSIMLTMQHSLPAHVPQCKDTKKENMRIYWCVRLASHRRVNGAIVRVQGGCAHHGTQMMAWELATVSHLAAVDEKGVRGLPQNNLLFAMLSSYLGPHASLGMLTFC